MKAKFGRSQSPYGGADLSYLSEDFSPDAVPAAQNNTPSLTKSGSQSPYGGVKCSDLSYRSEDISPDPLPASQDNTTDQNKSRSPSPYGGATSSVLSYPSEANSTVPVPTSEDNIADQNKSRSQSPYGGTTCSDLAYPSEVIFTEPVPASQDNTTNQNKSSLLALFPNTRHHEEYIHKVIKKFDFIKDCLYELMETVEWRSLIQVHHMHQIRDLEKDDSEFVSVHSKFMALNAKSSFFKITKIQQNCNPFLLISYHLMKSKYIKEYGWVKEIALFHGTTSSKADSICENNFDWRMTGSAKGHKFGKGVSFSPDSYYASHYGNRSVMILTDVFVSNTSIGDIMTCVPTGNTDTTVNLAKSVYVKYDDNMFYPKYIINYT